MFDQVSVLIPYQSDNDGPRDAAFRWVLDFYTRSMPGIEICIGKVSGNPFSRSKAINCAARQATRNKFIIADCDIVYDPNLVLESISYLSDYQWVIPFSRILRLPEDASQLVLAQTPGWPISTELGNRDENSAYYFGGLNVLQRNAFEAVGGYDERFIGWGGEDEAFAYALDTLIGTHVRLDGEMVHFWHPFVGPEGNPHYETNYALYKKYKEARGHVQSMRKLIPKE
jgi:hypothetical protein